jgi:hypothetical protein
MKKVLTLPLAALFAIVTSAQSSAAPKPSALQPDLPIVAAPPGVMIDFYPVSTEKRKGGRFINTRGLPRLGYVDAAPALQVERLRSVKKVKTTKPTTVQSADGKKRTESVPVPAIEMTLSSADAKAFTELMKKSVGQRIYIEAEGTPIYAPLVREALPATTLTFSLGDDAELEAAYAKLARFVKK